MASARDLAFRLATESSDHDLVAELCESARLQVLPANGGVSEAGRSTRSHVTAPALISVAGRSALADAWPARSASGDIISLETTIEAVGGLDCWWWSHTIGLDGAMYWCVRTPQGVLSSGSLLVSDEDMDFLQSIGDALFDGNLSDVAIALSNGGSDIEAQVMRRLGDLTVPDPIREVCSSGEPIRLVVAGEIFAFLPMCAAIIPGTDLHLVEKATIVNQAPCIVVDHVLRHPFYFVDRYPTLVAILDPAGDLPFAAATRVQASATFVSEKGAGERSGRLATIEAVTACLSSLQRSVPGCLVYSGHATGRDDPASGTVEHGLVLWNGVLSAGQIFSENLAMPSRVLLSACGSAGSFGAGRGEWLGLGAAALVAGARQVIATAWPIADSAATQQMDEQLAERMTTSGDLAASLRIAQLALLNQSRDFTIGSSLRPGIRFWAAFQLIGLGW